MKGEKMSLNCRSEDVARLASATLSRLNSMLRETGSWHEERLALQSKVNRLKSALQKLGKSPDEALGPDPLIVHQRSEINRLELTADRLKAEIRSLREALLEADQAISCSGARRLRDKMTKVRAEGVEERRKLEDEIKYLKVRVQEAEEEFSCSSLGRLRLKLREISEVDKKMEQVIADVASRSYSTVIELLNELTRIKHLLDDLRLENIRLNDEKRKLKVSLVQRKDSGLLKRVANLEETLEKNQKELEARDAVATSLRNEVIGAKFAYKIQSEELAGFKGLKTELATLKEVLKNREDHVAGLERRLELSARTFREAERLRAELNGAKAELLSLRKERDELLDRIEKLGAMVSDRNERIAGILEKAEAREKEIEGVRTRLCVACAENERLKLRCEDVEEELSKLNGTSKASGDRSAPLVERIKELEEELAEVKRRSCLVRRDPQVKILQHQVLAVQTSKMWLKEDQSDFGGQMESEKVNEGTGTELTISEIKDQDTQTNDDSEEKLRTFESFLKKVTIERDALKNGYKKLLCENRRLNVEVEESKTKFVKLALANESLNEKLRGYENLREKLRAAEDRLDKALEEVNASRATKARVDNDLRVENDELKSSLEKEKRDRSEMERAMEKLRVEFEKRSKALGEVKNWSEKSRDGETETETLVMNCGDYVRADMELKYYIHLQSLAVKRVVDFISYLDCGGGGRPKPAMAKFLEPTASDLTILNFDENITATFRMSQKLSGKIFTAEIEVQKLEAIVNEANHLRAERDCLNQGMEKLSGMLRKLGQGISVASSSHLQLRQYDSLTVFEREAELFPENDDRDLVLARDEDQNSKIEDEREFSGMNARISSLRTRIILKQEEAAERLIEMRETMRQERIRLMEIADRANVTL